MAMQTTNAALEKGVQYQLPPISPSCNEKNRETCFNSLIDVVVCLMLTIAYDCVFLCCSLMLSTNTCLTR